jgi:hypothetical protein
MSAAEIAALDAWMTEASGAVVERGTANSV